MHTVAGADAAHLLGSRCSCGASMARETVVPRTRVARVSALVGGAALLASLQVEAQELEPRQYSNVPVGTNFVVSGYALSEGNVLVDPSIELENAALEIDGLFVGYARSVSLGGVSGKVDAVLARVCLDGSADFEGQRFTRDVCGLADAKVRLSANFIGAPALRARDYAAHRHDLIAGASLQLSVPTGAYDTDRLINIGANRWAAKAEIGVSKAARGWIFEAALAGTFYEANDQFRGDQTREQDAIYSLQGHVIHGLPSGIWFAVDATHYRGGRTSIDGVRGRDLQSNTRLGLTASLPITASQSLKLNWSRGVSTRTGTDFDTVGVAWQYRWGAEPTESARGTREQ